ncbi:MAG: peptidoglycan recognition protein, partial [Actinobacteria bacterium]|nr:peptidoglycan recognition protein [Actinomycetota bacterium]
MKRVAVVLLAATALWVGWPNSQLVSAAPKTVSSSMSSAAGNHGGRAPIRFNMVAASWKNKNVHDALVRTTLDGKTWSAWRELEAEIGEGPDAGEHGNFNELFTSLLWVGDARYVQTKGVPAGRIHLLNVEGTADDPSTPVAMMRSFGNWLGGAAQPAYAAGSGPVGIYTRAQWGANEKLREQTLPKYAPQNKMALIHHTDTGNGYSRDQVPSILRGIYAYHVKNRGYRDIAYNFLVDRFGRMWEGRWGGMDKTVVGGHTAGFNYGTIGVAMIGTYMTTTPTSYTQAAISRLLSWKFSVHHIKPRAKVLMTVRSSPAGGQRWAVGTNVWLNTISAHRDVNYTSCNGTKGYRTLPWIRTHAWVRTPPAGAYVYDGLRYWLLTATSRYLVPTQVLDVNVPRGEVLRRLPSELRYFPVIGTAKFKDGTLVRPDTALPEATPSPDPSASPAPSDSPSPDPTVSPTPAAPKTYIVSNGSLRAFASDADLVAMGYNAARVILTSASSLSTYSVGADVDPGVYPDGTL